MEGGFDWGRGFDSLDKALSGFLQFRTADVTGSYARDVATVGPSGPPYYDPRFYGPPAYAGGTPGWDPYSGRVVGGGQAGTLLLVGGVVVVGLLLLRRR
jgi:hypothetical protein